MEIKQLRPWLKNTCYLQHCLKVGINKDRTEKKNNPTFTQSFDLLATELSSVKNFMQDVEGSFINIIPFKSFTIIKKVK